MTLKEPRERKLNFRPLYIQACDELLARIRNNEWPPGSALPNEIALASELGVSVGTVRKAVEDLVDRHIVERIQGRGTFLVDPTSREMRLRFNNIQDASGARLKGTIEVLHKEVAEGDAHERERMNLRSGDRVIRTERVRSHGGRAFMWECVRWPESLFPTRSEANHGKTVSDLARQNCVLLGRATERISLCVPPAEGARSLGVPKDAGLMHLDRTIFTVDDRAAEWRTAWCNLEAESYAVTLR